MKRNVYIKETKSKVMRYIVKDNDYSVMSFNTRKEAEYFITKYLKNEEKVKKGKGVKLV